MGKDPDAIREEIAMTREGMNDKVEALGYKMDVKSRTRERVRDMASKPKDALMHTTQSVKEKLGGHGSSGNGNGGSGLNPKMQLGKAKSVAGDTVGTGREKVTTVASRGKDGAVFAKDKVKQNPVGLALGGVALGMLAGLMAPRTRMEDEKLGSVADNVKDKVKETGTEAIEHGKQIAQEAATAAADTAKEQTREHGDEMKDEAKDKMGTSPSSQPTTSGAIPTGV